VLRQKIAGSKLGRRTASGVVCPACRKSVESTASPRGSMAKRDKLLLGKYGVFLRWRMEFLRIIFEGTRRVGERGCQFQESR